MPLRSLRNSAAPSSCCLPPAARGPVRTVRNPTLSGSEDCASARGAGKMLIAAPAFKSVRRDIPDLLFIADMIHSSLFAQWFLLSQETDGRKCRQPWQHRPPVLDQPHLSDIIRTSSDFRHHPSGRRMEANAPGSTTYSTALPLR